MNVSFPLKRPGGNKIKLAKAERRELVKIKQNNQLESIKTPE